MVVGATVVVVDGTVEPPEPVKVSQLRLTNSAACALRKTTTRSRVPVAPVTAAALVTQVCQPPVGPSGRVPTIGPVAESRCSSAVPVAPAAPDATRALTPSMPVDPKLTLR